MTYFSADFNAFGGLVLNAAPDEVGPQQAIDLLNVDFDKPGAVRSRDGWSALGAQAMTPTAAIEYISGTGESLVVVNDALGKKLYALDSTGSVIVSGTTSFESVRAFARVGTPSTDLVYGITPAAAGMVKFTGAAFSDVSPASFPAAVTSVAVQPADNRLVVASGSTVKFSAKGAPETWTGADVGSVDLDPGNGEVIRGMVAWGSYLFVFKENAFYRFYGNTLAADGTTPVFNFNTVRGVGMAPWTWDACCASPEGVYFLGRDGVYFTAGGAPRRISGALDPLFRNAAGSYWTGGNPDRGYARMAGIQAHDEFTGTTAGGTLNGRTPPLGAAWATSGNATDFTFSDNGFGTGSEEVSRSVSETTPGRFGVLGSAMTDTAVSALVTYGGGGNADTNGRLSLIGRFVDTSNYLIFKFGLRHGDWQITQVVAGASTDLAFGQLASLNYTNVTLRLVVFANGSATATAVMGGTTLLSQTVSSAALATGGALQSGKAGINDLGSSTLVPHYYDNIVVSTPGAPVTGPMLAWTAQSLYVGFGSAYPGMMLVYYPSTQSWSVWTPGSFSFLLPVPDSGGSTRLLIGSTTGNVVGQFVSGQTTDNGAAINAYWRSGFYDMSYRSRSGYWVGATEKTIRETLLWGTGSVNVQLAHDYASLDAGATVAMTPGTKPGRRRFAVRGTNFSHQLASVSGGAWTVQRLAQHVRGNRPVGIETTVAP